jgi:hypothetical protein
MPPTTRYDFIDYILSVTATDSIKTFDHELCFAIIRNWPIFIDFSWASFSAHVLHRASGRQVAHQNLAVNSKLQETSE